MGVNVKDFVAEVPVAPQVPKKKQQNTQSKYTYEVILQNNTDFVINKKTRSTNMNLVVLVSQSNFYIKDNKTDIIYPLTEPKLRGFFNHIINDSYHELDKVDWWKKTKVSANFERMIDLIKDKSMQTMYKHGFYLPQYECRDYKDIVEKNIKLFKYCYDKTYTTGKNFKDILNIASQIEKVINYNNAKIFIDEIADSNVRINLWGQYYNTFSTLTTKYSLNFNRFIEYICHDLYTQGIDEFNSNRLQEYMDYLDMQIKLYGEVKEKYSKHLATDHDIITLKYNTYKKHSQDLIMLNVVENQKELLYQKGEYAIILPTSTVDIVEEGINQSHCVASYVDRVLDNKTLIVFMRRKEELSTSLITIEVKDKTVTQVRGFANRRPTIEEDTFIKQWTKEKKLNYKKEGN